ncbi:glycosyltransferase family 4 protein [Candidatus Poribacteria bacterium]|nr:glycosyltransferase family 4 protein [Candidatus Poribacteria bacterium]
MKVAVVHPSLAIKGGAENLMVWMARGLSERGYSVTLFSTDYSEELWNADGGVQLSISLLKPGFLSRMVNSKRLKVADFSDQLSGLLAGYEVVFCSLFPTHLWVARARRRGKGVNCRIIWYLQEPARKYYWKITDRHIVDHARYCQNPLYNEHLRKCVESRIRGENSWKSRRQILWDRDAVKQIDLILANSEFSADNISRAFEAPVKVCYPGIPVCPDVRLPQPGDYLLTVSPLRGKKNVHNVIEALHLLSAKMGRTDIRLKIAGQGPSRAELEVLVRERNLTSQVEFLGFLDDFELADAYKKARLTVYIPVDEPFGLIAAESMSHRVPPIVSDHGGVSEIVSHNQTGLLVNPFDPEKVAEAIASLWDDTERIQRMGRAGRERVEAMFTQRHFLDRVEGFLRT